MAAPIDRLAEFTGASPGIVAVRQQIARLIEHDRSARRLPSVLLLGETGTGKGLLARLIHRASVRADRPFVGVNCAAIPETLLEAELFGFERGAFTDARQAKPGLFQSAHRGTLLLDEVGMMPLALQAKLLSVLEDHSVRRLGSTRAEPVDVWILAATNEDLLAATRDRRFREDLYHRLSAVTVRIPPLRERGADLLAMAERFLAQACADYGVAARQLTPNARAALLAYRWPGNVRELGNLMERVALLTDDVAVTEAHLDLPAAPGAPDVEPESREAPPLRGSLGDFERAQLMAALESTRWNISQAAARLGVPRNTLRYRIEKHVLGPGAASPPGRQRRAEPPTPPAPVTPIPEPPPAPIGIRWERRFVTLLRIGLVTPSAAPSTTDVGRIPEVLVEKVGSFGGRIEELSPTGITAAFGLEPVEDAPRRAALAAITIQKAAERGWGRDAEDITVRAGIHTAELMLGRMNDTTMLDQDAKREVWAVLEALIERATPGSILVSGPARSILERRFELVPAGTLDRPPGRLYRLEGREWAGLGLGGRLARFVGRHHELELLRSRLASVVTGQGQVVGIVGDAGIGKSRLLLEFRQSLAGHKATYLEAHCVSYGSGVPYLPVLDLLRDNSGIIDTDTPEAIAEKLRRGVQEVGMEAEEGVPYLLHLLGVKEGTGRLEVLSPEAIKARTFEILRQMCVKGSRRRPIILIVEDFQWVDTMSEEFFASLVESLTGAPILLVVTYRPGYRPPWLEKSYATQVALRPLSAEDSLTVLQSVLPTRALDDPMIQAILEKAEGNPFFLEELARAVADNGELHRIPAIPDTIQGVLLARIDRLPPPDKSLLQCAAVVGKDVPLALLQAISDLPEDAVRLGLRRLQAAEFVHETSVGPEPEYSLRHTLTHEVAYGSLLAEQRRDIHARIVAAIERLYSGRLVGQVERLAHHALRAETWGKAVTYLRQAGVKAASRSANREALACFEQALGALKYLPESREWIEEGIDLRFDLRTALQPLGNFGPMLDHLREAAAHAKALGDERRLGRVLAYLTDYWRLVGDQDRALEYGREALELAESLGDPTLQIRANTYLGQVHHSRGDYRRAAVFFRKNVEGLVDDLVRELFGSPQPPSIHSRTCLVWCLTELGEFAEGIVRGEEGVRIAESIDDPLSLTTAYSGLGYLWLVRGDASRAIPLLERAVGLIRAWNIALWFPRVASFLGSAYALAGRVPEASIALAEAVDRSASMGLMGGHSLLVMALGEAELRAGRLGDALGLAERARDLARRHKERGYEAWALRLLGAIALEADQPDPAIARDRYREAMALADELGMRPLLAHCQTGLGRACRQAGDRPAAREHLSVAAGLLREMDMTPWVSETEAELAALG